MQDQRRIESLVSVNLTKGLQLLSELDLSNALDDFVNRDPSAISKLVERRMKETQALVDQEAAGDVESDDEMAEHIRKAVAESAARSAPTERAQAQQQGNSELVAVSDIFTDLEMRLANPSPISYDDFKALDSPLIVEQDEDGVSDVAFRTPIWEIDGTIKVFLKYINRVPYLHVDSEMYYRQPVPLHYFSNEEASTNNVSNEKGSAADNSEGQAYKLVSVPLVEQRRIISTQLHYFDHPLFGFIVQVRRYNRPSVEE